MFGWYDDGPRTWKWAVPGFLALALGYWGMKLSAMSSQRSIGVFMVIAALFLAAICATIWWERVSTHQEELHRQRREADAITPTGMILESAKGVHPETYRLALGERARRWGLVSGTKSLTGEPYAVLMSRPRVTDAFLVHFLRMSNEQTYMPKRMLSENDHSFDPRRIVTSYEMYDDLESLLVEELKATRPFGNNKPGYWLGEWEPYAAGLDFGVDINEWQMEEDASPLTPTSPLTPLLKERGLEKRGEKNLRNDVIASALEGLEQTQAMKARTAQLLKK